MLFPVIQPLMERVQAALGAQLVRQNEKLEIELREKASLTLKALKILSENCCIFVARVVEKSKTGTRRHRS